jgi:hypothetical protein
MYPASGLRIWHRGSCRDYGSTEDAARELDRLRAALAPGEIPCLDPPPEPALTATGQSGRKYGGAAALGPQQALGLQQTLGSFGALCGAAIGSVIGTPLPAITAAELDAIRAWAQRVAANSRETDAEREARIRRSPSTWILNDMSFLLELLDKSLAAAAELQGKLQYASAVGAAAMSTQHAERSGSPAIDVDAWLAARAEEQFRQRAASNDWIERLHGDYQSRL